MAKRHVIAVQRDHRGLTVSLCNPEENWSPVSTQAAIGQISAGLHNYYTGRPDAPRYLSIVHAGGGAYLRSEHDAEPENNLDILPSCDGANPLTGQFDVLVEFSQDAINSAVAAMHAAGVITHQASVVVDGHVAVLGLGAHRISLTPTVVGTATAVATVPFVCWLRRLDRLDDPGDTGTGTVRAQVACYTVVEGDDSLTLATDWSNTTSDDITVMGAAADVQDLIAKAILSWARSAGGRYRVPDMAVFGAPIGIALRFAENPAGRVVQVGLDLALPVGQVFPTPSVSSVRLALSGRWIASRVVAALGDQFGALPPPHGQNEVPLDSGTSLTALDVELGDNELSVYGAVRVGITSAKFTVTVDLTGTTPQNLRATVRSVKVDVNDLLSTIADFFTAGAIRSAMATGIRNALRGGGSGGIIDLLSRQVLGSVTALGSAARVGLDVRINKMRLTRHGVVFTGDLVAPPPPPIRANLRVQELADRWRVLFALDSWTPGDSIKSVTYDFGDGKSAKVRGGQLALAATHRYKAGRWRAAVTVTDRAGRTARAERSTNVH